MRRQQTTFVVHIFNINRFSAAVFRCGCCCWALLCTRCTTCNKHSWYAFEWRMIRCSLPVVFAIQSKLFCISTNFGCSRCEYKIPILKCCCFISCVCFLCVSQSISNGGHFFSLLHALLLLECMCCAPPSAPLSVCALFGCRRRRRCCWWWCWCWYGNFIVRIQCSVLNFVIMLCFYFYSSHLFAKISMCDKMWMKNADASRFLRLYIY